MTGDFITTPWFIFGAPGPLVITLIVMFAAAILVPALFWWGSR